MRRAREAAISLLALIVLLVALVSVDDRVREQVASIAMTSDSSELADAGKGLTSLVGVVFDAVKDQSVAHAPLVIFGAAATVLVLFMVRT